MFKVAKMRKVSANLSQYGIKELKDELILDTIKEKFPWVLEAEIKDAILGYDGYALVWYSGNWLTGIWHAGIWKSGIWMAVLSKKPLISQEELSEIMSLSNLVKEDELVMATDSYYSPWVYGFSGRKTIAPGLFEYNKWNRDKWAAFWLSPDLKLRHFLLDEYKGPIYIFVGDKQHPMDFSDDPRFTRRSKRIWKYE